MDDKNQFIDQLLDSALLAHRQKGEPRSGVEGRVLEHVRSTPSEQDSRGKVWKLWVATAATTAALSIVAAIYTIHRLPKPTVQTSQSGKTVPAATPLEKLTADTGSTPKAGTATTIPDQKRAARRKARPSRHIEAAHWPSQFPSPTPLSKEETALIQYVRDTPPQVLADPGFRESAIQPIEIKPLRIPPIKIKHLALRAAMEATE